MLQKMLQIVANKKAEAKGEWQEIKQLTKIIRPKPVSEEKQGHVESIYIQPEQRKEIQNDLRLI